MSLQYLAFWSYTTTVVKFFNIYMLSYMEQQFFLPFHIVTYTQLESIRVCIISVHSGLCGATIRVTLLPSLC